MNVIDIDADYLCNLMILSSQGESFITLYSFDISHSILWEALTRTSKLFLPSEELLNTDWEGKIFEEKLDHFRQKEAAKRYLNISHHFQTFPEQREGLVTRYCLPCLLI